MAYEKLKAHAAKLGYSHLSLEFCVEMQTVTKEFEEFMAGMRELLAPVDDEPDYTIGETLEIAHERRRRHEDLYAPGELVIREYDETNGAKYAVLAGEIEVANCYSMDEAQKFIDENTGDR